MLYQKKDMAKFRMNHARQGKGGIGKIRPLYLIIIGLAIIWGLNQFPDFMNQVTQLVEDEPIEVPDRERTDYENESLFFLPKGNEDQIIRHKYYALGYVEKHELAEWVAHELTREQIQAKNVPREDNFRADPKVKTSSAYLNDYRGSGYDRGHLVPVGDRNFSFEAMDETFYLSNIAPQIHEFNGGIWRELEELTRDWAYKYKKVYVTTGPILTQKRIDRIGQNNVTVPAAFYKVILDVSEPELKGIGFIIPNEKSNELLKNFAVSIDEVELQTGIDFFPELVSDELEEQLESQFDNKLWKYNAKKYELRINKWNNW